MLKPLGKIASILSLPLLGLLASCSNTTEASTQAQLDIVNQYSRPVVHVYYTPCETESWGADRLSGGTIASGGTRSWTVSAGCWDVKVVASDGATWLNMGEDVAHGFALTLTAR